MRGTCLCGAVTFELTEPFVRVSHCHCTTCKRISGGVGTVTGRVRTDAVEVLTGRDLITTYVPEEGTGKSFCSVCGSNLFGSGWPDVRAHRRPPERARQPLRGEAGDAHLGAVGRSVGDAPGRRRRALSAGCTGTMKPAYLLDLGETPYAEAWDLQRSLAAAVLHGAIPDTVIMLEHPPVITVGRRTDEEELHVPADATVEVVETDRGGKSTYHAPGQLVCYPILDLNRHGRDVKKYCRDLEEAVIQTLAAYGLEGTRIDGLTGVWLTPPPRKICSIGVHVSRWVTTHGYALNVDLDPAPFTSWITACGLEDTSFTTMARELSDPPRVADVRPVAAAAIADVFDLDLEPLPAEDGAGLWPQPVHERIGAK